MGEGLRIDTDAVQSRIKILESDIDNYANQLPKIKGQFETIFNEFKPANGSEVRRIMQTQGERLNKVFLIPQDSSSMLNGAIELINSALSTLAITISKYSGPSVSGVVYDELPAAGSEVGIASFSNAISCSEQFLSYVTELFSTYANAIINDCKILWELFNNANAEVQNSFHELAELVRNYGYESSSVFNALCNSLIAEVEDQLAAGEHSAAYMQNELNSLKSKLSDFNATSVLSADKDSYVLGEGSTFGDYRFKRSDWNA